MMPPGPVFANDAVRYSFTGKASHAATAPEAGRSALNALELMNIGVHFLREHIPSIARIHYAITNAGGISPNIVQAYASALYQIRAPFAPELSNFYERINNIAKGAAMMTETQVEIKFLKGTSNTVLIPALDEVMYNNMCEIPNPVERADDIAEKLSFEYFSAFENSVDPDLSTIRKKLKEYEKLGILKSYVNVVAKVLEQAIDGTLTDKNSV